MALTTQTNAAIILSYDDGIPLFQDLIVAGKQTRYAPWERRRSQLAELPACMPNLTSLIQNE